MKISMRIISVFLVLLMAFTTVSIGAQALKIDECHLDLGCLLPTNTKGTKNLSTVNLYGDYDYINFKYKTRYSSVYYVCEIYSDKDYKNSVGSAYFEAEDGKEKKCSVLVKLKGNFKSKTYYGVTYAFQENSSNSIAVDPDSFYKFKIKVKRSADFADKIVPLKSVENTVNGPKITWTSLSGAKKYEILRRNSGSSKWKKVDTVSGSKKTFTDKSVKNNVKKYVYSVKAINKKGVESRYHYQGLYCYFVRAPKITSVKVVSGNGVEIKWEKAGSFRYTVFRKELGGDWEILHPDFGGTKWVDKTVENGKTYRYTIRVGINDSYMSDYISENGEAITFLKSPELKELTNTDNDITVSWGAVEGASSYIVMRKEYASSEAWKELGVVDGNILEFTDATADMQKSYSYTVRSKGENGLGSYDGVGLEYIILGKPNASISSVVSYDPNLSWTSVLGAHKYEVYMSYNNGDWTLVKTLETTTFPKYSRVLDGVGVYQFKVRAIRNDGKVGEYSEPVATKYYPTLSISGAIGDGNISVSWSDYINKCDSYNLYRRNALDETAEYELIANLTEAKYVDNTIEPDGLYEYQVRMVKNNIEQDVNLRSCLAGVSPTLKGNPKIWVEDNRIFFDKAWQVYGYNFTTQSWEQLEFDSKENTKENHSKYCKDGKYRYGFMFKNGGVISVLENNVVDYEWYSVKVKYKVELISEGKMRLTITKPTKEIDYYEAQVGKVSSTMRTDGSSGYSFVDDEYFWSSKEEYSKVTIKAVTKNGDISTTTGRFYYMKTPKISEISRKKNGDVKLTIKQYNFGAPDWDGYYIYRKTEGSSKWKKIKTLKSVPTKGNKTVTTTYTDKSAKKGKKYTYTVKSYKKYNNETFVSYYVKKGKSIK